MDSCIRSLLQVLFVQEKFSCVSEVSLLDCSQMESAFSETQRAAELLQQFGGFIFILLNPFRFSFARRHTRFCPVALLGQHSVCIILGTLSVASLRYFSGEYLLWRWISNFQGSVQNKYLLDFCPAMHYTEPVFRHSFQRFCSCPQRQK